MNLTTATPVEIDTVIAEIYVRYYRQRYECLVLAKRIEQYEEGLAKKAAGNLSYMYWTEDALLRAQDAHQDAQQVATDIWSEQIPFNAEWVRRGRWSRFYLVDNGSGHVHKSMDCSTTYPTTEWVWLPEFSGADEAGVVALARSQACTVCFPSAPVDSRRGSIENPAKRKSRLQREAEKAARLAAKIEKGLTDDGSELLVEWVEDAPGYDRNSFGEKVWSIRPRLQRERFKTERAAVTWMVQQKAYGAQSRGVKGPAFDRIVLALAEKHSKTVEEVNAEIAVKVAAYLRRNR